MQLHFIMGGDARLEKSISYEEIILPSGRQEIEKILARIKEVRFPGLAPLQFNEKTSLHRLPTIACCACQFYALPIRQTLEETLTLTHIHHSLRMDSGLEGRKIVYLFCSRCAKEIKEIFLAIQANPDTKKIPVKPLSRCDPRIHFSSVKR